MATKLKRKPAKKRAKPAPAAKATKLKKSSKPAKAKARAAKPVARKAAARKSAKRPAAKTAGKPSVKRAAKAAAAPTPAPVPAPAPAPAAAVLPPSSVTLARVLDALHARTGNNGGDHAAADVKRYREANGDVDDATALFVRALPIKNWYVDPDKPDAAELDNLWISVRRKMGRAEVPKPGGWNKDSSTSTLNRVGRETQP